MTRRTLVGALMGACLIIPATAQAHTATVTCIRRLWAADNDTRQAMLGAAR